MKKVRKAILLALCAVLLVGASVAGTLAYLTSQTKTLTNTFTVGKVEITLTEAKTDAYGQKVNEQGNPDSAEGNDEVRLDGSEGRKGNSYVLVPGQTYHKDPTLTVKQGSEDCIVFVKVKEPNETAKNVIGYELNLPLSGGVADTSNLWGKFEDTSTLENVEDGETLYYKLFTKDELKDEDKVFYLLKNPTPSNNQYKNGGFKIKSEATETALNDLTQNGNTIGDLEFTAYAIQQNGFSTNGKEGAIAAWNALQEQIDASATTPTT